MTRLKDKVQNALDEARLLILGTQVLLGLQYRAAFETGFEKLPAHSRYLSLAGLVLLLLSLGLLIWPGAFHRIVSRGEDTEAVHRFTTGVMEVTLLPFAIALAVDLFVAAEKVAGVIAGIAIGSAGAAIALLFWYGIELSRQDTKKEATRNEKPHDQGIHKDTKLRNKIAHVLTETRVVLPGAQALLGFQFVTILMEGFDELPPSSRYVHLASLCMIAASIILLMTPAAYHRIVEKGNESERFHSVASRLLLAAMIPLPLGICGDYFVVAQKITGSATLALTSAGALLVLFYGLWFGLTFYWRLSGGHEHRPSGRRSFEVSR